LTNTKNIAYEEEVTFKAKKATTCCMEVSVKTKDEGGLGIIKLRLQNDAFLMKNLHKFFNKADLPWVQLLWSKYYSNGKVPDTVKRGGFWW
jgi:hypothetical protein